MMRHREQEDLRRHPDGFKPNYMDNVSTAGIKHAVKHFCTKVAPVTLAPDTYYSIIHSFYSEHHLSILLFNTYIEIKKKSVIFA